MDRLAAVMNYWFEDLTDETVPVKGEGPSKKWFKKSHVTDEEIRSNFEEDVIKASNGTYDDWLETAKGTLGLIILLDQFPRNIYRGSPKSFSNDRKALECALSSIEKGFNECVFFVYQPFIYMPLMHSEDFAIQEKSVYYFEKLWQDAKDFNHLNVNVFKSNYDYAVRHFNVIKQFGRFPHRNEILGRQSTAEESEFLKGPNSSF